MIVSARKPAILTQTRSPNPGQKLYESSSRINQHIKANETDTWPVSQLAPHRFPSIGGCATNPDLWIIAST